jgi:hypothetical protein
MDSYGLFISSLWPSIPNNIGSIIIRSYITSLTISYKTILFSLGNSQNLCSCLILSYSVNRFKFHLSVNNDFNRGRRRGLTIRISGVTWITSLFYSTKIIRGATIVTFSIINFITIHTSKI